MKRLVKKITPPRLTPCLPTPLHLLPHTLVPLILASLLSILTISSHLFLAEQLSCQVDPHPNNVYTRIPEPEFPRGPRILKDKDNPVSQPVKSRDATKGFLTTYEFANPSLT